jgi:hypothetical protein
MFIPGSTFTLEANGTSNLLGILQFNIKLLPLLS